MRIANPKFNMPLVKNPPRVGNPIGKPMGKPGVKMAMGGTVKARPTSPGGVSAVRPGESYAPGMGKKFPGMTLRPGDVTNKPPRVPPRVSGGPTRLPPGMTAPTGMGMKKGGMATKKKVGKISEYGGKEMYSSKKGMMKHEGMESMKMEKSEGKMKHGGMAKKGRGMAIMIAIGKPKGRGKS